MTERAAFRAALDAALWAHSLAPDVEVHDTLSSTNDRLRQLAVAGAPSGQAVIALRQTAGRGRQGRSFFSPPGTGLYLSVLLRPRDLPARDAVLLTPMAAVAVCEAAESLCGVTAQIKWVNDVLVGGKKICGILTEATCLPGSDLLDWAAVGIGVNLLPPPGGFPASLPDAGALSDRGAPIVERAPLAAELLARLAFHYGRFADRDFVSAYRARSSVVGREIQVQEGGESYPAQALGIDERCRLRIRTAAGERTLDFGEISIRT